MFKLLVDAVEDYSIHLLSPEGVVASWNRGAQRIKGYTADEIIGSSFVRFFTAEGHDNGTPELILREARTTGRYEIEGWRVRKDGSRFWANVVVNAVTDSAGTLLGFAKITRNIAVARETAQALTRAATTDPLTGTWNRTEFLKQLEKWEHDQLAFSVAIIDLNDFKRVNDTLGHAAGDVLLKTAAHQLASDKSRWIVTARL